MENQNYSIMKRSQILFVSFILLATSGLFAQSVEKTLVRSFNIQEAQVVALQVDHPVEVKTWSQKIMRVQINVGLDRGSESMLRSLVQAGRYNLKGGMKNDYYVVTIPGLSREVRVNGAILAENLSYVIFVPENVHVDVLSSSSAQAF